MTNDMTTMKIQNIKSHLLRSLMVVAMMVWGVGSSWGQTRYEPGDTYTATWQLFNSAVFAIVDESPEKAIYGSTGTNIAYAAYNTSLSSGNTVIQFRVDDGWNNPRLVAMTPNGSDYYYNNKLMYLSAPSSAGGSLTLQESGTVWTFEYSSSNNGWTIKTKTDNYYIAPNTTGTGVITSTNPYYWTCCSLEETISGDAVAEGEYYLHLSKNGGKQYLVYDNNGSGSKRFFPSSTSKQRWKVNPVTEGSNTYFTFYQEGNGYLSYANKSFSFVSSVTNSNGTYFILSSTGGTDEYYIRPTDNKNKNEALGSNASNYDNPLTLINYKNQPNDTKWTFLQYKVKIDDAIENGTVTASRKTALDGDVITLTVTPNSGYDFESLTVTDADGNTVETTETADGYQFTMPASDVEVSAAFVEQALIDDDIRYVIFDRTNTKYLGSSNTTLSEFNPKTCVWNQSTAGDGYLRLNSGNSFLSLYNSVTMPTSSTINLFNENTWGLGLKISNSESGDDGSTIYGSVVSTRHYLYYSSGWKTTTSSGSAGKVVYKVTISSSPEKKVNPTIQGLATIEDLTSNLSTTPIYSRNGGSYQIAFKDYIFYNGRHHYWSTDDSQQLSTSTDASENVTELHPNLTYRWRLSNDADGKASIDPETGVITYSSYFAEDTEVTVILEGKIGDTVILSAEKKVTFWARRVFDIEVAESAGGTYTVSKEHARKDELITLTLENTKRGYEFGSWVVTQTGTTTTEMVTGDTFLMPAHDVTVSANFNDVNYKITTETEILEEDGTYTTSTAAGTIVGGNKEYRDGTQVTLEAKTSEGYRFLEWKEDRNTNATRVIEVSGPATYTAVFEAIKYSVTTEVPEGGGTISADPATNIIKGTPVDLTATPAIGYEVTSWKIMDADDDDKDITNDVGLNYTAGENTATFKMPATNVKVTATFTLKEYSITINNVAGGTITASASKATMGQEVELSVDVADGYEFQSWVVKGPKDALITVTDNKFTMPAGNVTVTATYGAKTYTIEVNVTPVDGGTAIVSTPTGELTGHVTDRINLTLTPGTGKHLKSAVVKRKDNQDEFNVSSDGSGYYFNMPPSDVIVTVEFIEYETGPCKDDPSMTWIASLREITSATGRYRLAIDNPLGEPGVTEFSGVLDGYFHTISGRTSALFNKLNGATVKNVTLNNVQISSGNTNGNVGAISNEATNSRIYNCSVLATGSKADQMEDDKRFTSSSRVSGTNYVGGILGLLSGSTSVVNCVSYADVSGGTWSGGIVGYIGTSSTYGGHSDDGTTSDWTTDGSGNGNFRANNTNRPTNYSGNLQGGTMEVWRSSNLNNQTITHNTISNLPEGIYNIEMDLVVRKGNASDVITGVTFTVNGDTTNPLVGGTTTDYYYEIHICKQVAVGKNGSIAISMTLTNVNFNWMLWDNLTVTLLSPSVVNCMALGEVTGTERSPIVGGTNPITNNSIYSYFRYKSLESTNGLTQNGALAIQEDMWLKRFEFFRSAVNNHRDIAAYYCLGSATLKDEMAIWLIDPDVSPWPILQKSGARKSTLKRKIPTTYRANEGNLITNGQIYTYEKEDGITVTENDVTQRYNMNVGNGGYLTVNYNVDGTKGSVQLPITDMDYSRYDYTWGKVVLPHANEFDGWTRDYSKVCIGWEITSMTGSAGPNATSFSDYNFADRNCTAKDIYNATTNPFIYAQGGNFIVPYGVTEITITAHFANAFYLSDANYDCTGSGGNGIGGTRPKTYHEQPVYTTLASAFSAMSDTRSPHSQAIVLVGNFHYTENNSSSYTGKGCTIMSVDDDNDQIPDYGWYDYNGGGRQTWPSIRWDFIPIYGFNMVQTNTPRPGLNIPKATGWFEMTETVICRTYEFEINDNTTRVDKDNGYGNNAYILNGGYFQQLVRNFRQDNANTYDRLSYLKVGGNAYIKEFFHGNHSSESHKHSIRPVVVTGGEISQCFMTGMGYKNEIITTDTNQPNNVRFYCSGGKIDKYLSAYNGYPVVDATMQVDHAKIGRFFGGGTSPNATVSGNITVTMNYSDVDFFCGGPEFGDMGSGKTVRVNTTGSTFGEFYGAGFGGTALTRITHGDGKNNSTYSLFNYSAENGGYDVSYEMEALLNDGGGDLYRFYDYRAALSLASTGNVTVNADKCLFRNSFYGGGCQGKVNGTITSTLTNCDVSQNAFGGGYKAVATTIDVYAATGYTWQTWNSDYKVFSAPIYPDPVVYTWVQGSDNSHDDTNHTLGVASSTVDMSTMGEVTGAITLTIDGGSVGGNVYGGGNESQSKSDATVTIKGSATVDNNVFGGGNLANVAGATEVNINGGTLNTAANTAVYGGGALANVGGDTKVNLNGGTVGSVYGGGLGQLADAKAGKEAIAATVGSTTVNVGKAAEGETPATGAVITGSVFGCNNLNGTPLGNTTVNVYKTMPQGDGYHVYAVYGGGNKAAYIPTNTALTSPNTTKVEVFNCDNSIQYVYGGGNAASSPATHVIIHGGQFDWVFGGGNGKTEEGQPYNMGANVGYYQDTDSANVKSHGASYGTGKAETEIYDGVINHLFGGSNTRGNIREAAISQLEHGDCDFQIGEVYAAGNEAYMDGTALLNIGCIPGMAVMYGGARAANINNDVELTITSGTYGRIFGGNNIGGVINGSITVNIEETGCNPIIIGEVYGCGNNASYTTPEGKPDPVVNATSFTQIGAIYGGGFGSGATVTGNPTVSINMIKGNWAGKLNDMTGITPPDALGIIGNVFGGGNAAKVVGNTTVNVGTARQVTLESLKTDKVKTVLGANIQPVTVTIPASITGKKDTDGNGIADTYTGDGNVYGGGNEAEVTGKTNVVIGANKQ